MANAGDPTTLAGYAQGTWPPDGAVGGKGPATDTMRGFVTPVAGLLKACPVSLTGLGGQLMAYRQDLSGFGPASASGVVVLNTGGMAIAGNPLPVVTITGSTGITGALHLGRLLYYANSGNITLTLNSDPTGAAGVAGNFHCVVLRAYKSNTVGQVHVSVGAGLTLDRTDSNTGCASAVPVGVALIGTSVYLTGGVIA